MLCKYLEKVPNPFLCLKWGKCRWQRKAESGRKGGIKYTSKSHPGRRLYGCHKMDLAWERSLRNIRKKFWSRLRSFFRSSKECEEVQREMKLICPVCKLYKTETIICERCWDKIQILKIQKGSLGGREDWIG